VADRTQKLVLPGCYLRSLLAKYGISQEQFADSIRVSRMTVNQIVNNHRGITPEVALRIGKATRTDPVMWLNLQQQLDIRAARRNIGAELKQLPVLIKKKPQA